MCGACAATHHKKGPADLPTPPLPWFGDQEKKVVSMCGCAGGVNCEENHGTMERLASVMVMVSA